MRLTVFLQVLLLAAAGAADMAADSPVRFPKEGALPAKHPPDRPAGRNEATEDGYYIFRTPERSLAQIAAIQAEMPAGSFTPPPNDWAHLARTRRILTEGGELRLLALGDSIVNDTMRSGWVAKLGEAYPKAAIAATVYVRGGGGCQHYKEAGRIAAEVVPRAPDLVFIGGISQKDTESIRAVIGQLRAALPAVEILLGTGAFGAVDPRDAEALAKAPHSGTGAYGAALAKLAAEERCAFLDMTSPWAEYIRSSKLHPHLFYRDAVHANEHGEQILAKIMMAFWTQPAAAPPRPVTVACYYFGNYHPGDPRNAKRKGKDWSEWELVKNARPRFPGHAQPKVPLWGYEDESDPSAMARKIDAAADHGIDAFIFDWYYYDDGPFLDRPIDRGFLAAPNNGRIKFALMWANHDWWEIHPYRRGTPYEVVYPGKVTPETFATICDLVIARYFSHASYWRIDGRPYFSFYDLTTLLENFGSAAATRAALDAFRAKARDAGLPGLHLNAVVWGQPILPEEKKPADAAALVRDLGFDSVTSYVWVHHVPLPEQVTDYNAVRDAYFEYWEKARAMFGAPYFPNASMGWDSSPRAAQEDPFDNSGYPFTNTIGNNTPENFARALELTRERLRARPAGTRVLTINCWNEWTEGSYLEPDTVNGMRYLEAVKAVFPPAVEP